jgi:hypothetical protein
MQTIHPIFGIPIGLSLLLVALLKLAKSNNSISNSSGTPTAAESADSRFNAYKNSAKNEKEPINLKPCPHCGARTIYRYNPGCFVCKGKVSKRQIDELFEIEEIYCPKCGKITLANRPRCSRCWRKIG